MKNLNKMEKAVMEAIIEENKKDYPFLIEHFQHLKVKSRKYTGVGVYVNFGYTKELKKEAVSELISSNKSLVINSFKNEVSYVLDVTDGKINFLEIVTNGKDTFKNKKYEFKLI